MLIPEALMHLFVDLQLVESYAQGDTLFHRWDPRAKILLTLSALALFTQIRCFTGGIMFIFFLLLLIYGSQIPLGFLTKRVMSILILTVLISAISLVFVFPGPALYVIYIPPSITLTVSVMGVNQAGLLLVKVYASLLLMGWLLCTTPLTALFTALERLHTPRLFISLMMLTFRYILLMASETKNLVIAYSLRHPAEPKLRDRAKAIGVVLSQTIHQGYERGTRVYQAMTVRGYQGYLPCLTRFHISRRDGELSIMILGILVGLFMLDYFGFWLIGLPLIPRQLSDWLLYFVLLAKTWMGGLFT